MQIANQAFNRVIGVRLLVALFVIVMAAGIQPRAIDDIAKAINTFLLRITVDLVTYPPLNTPITIVHIPDVEYEAWLADIAGAESFMQLLQKINSDVKPASDSRDKALSPSLNVDNLAALKNKPDQPVVAFIAERPLILIQGRAEKLVAAWAQKMPVQPARFASELTAAANEREGFVRLAKNTLLVGGLAVSGGEKKNVSLKPYRLTAHTDLNNVFSRYVWPVTYEPYIEAATSPIQQFLLPSQTIAAPLLLQDDRSAIYESFYLRLLRIGAKHKDKLIKWSQGAPVKIGEQAIHMGFDGSVIPLYGNAAGMTAPVVQLTLAAALRAERLEGWVLIGRDQSPVLQNTAQILTAVNDGAYLTQPVFVPALKLLVYLLLFIACFVVLPRLSIFGFIVFFIASAILAVASQLLLSYVADYWLPTGDILITLAALFFLMLIWRARNSYEASLKIKIQKLALMSARLSYQDKHYLRALKLIKQVPIDKYSLKDYYKIADALLETGAAKEALPLWRLLYKRARHFKDVKQKINQCEKLLQVPVVMASSDKTQVICVNTSLEKLGRYQVRSVLGHGGSGVVYEGFDPVITRDVALKTLNLNVFSAQNQNKVKHRFLAEVKTVGKLNHPNIVSVFDVGKQDNWAYIAMDLARGKPLTEYVAKNALLPVAEVYWIGLKVAEALAFAHKQNIVHCDIKPGNIIYDRETFDVKVTDFGIAKWLDEAHTETGEIMGSPLYMAPEQLQGRPVVAQTDIFSLGATLHQLLTGVAPFNGRSIAEIQQAVLYSQPESLRAINESLPTSAARIVNRALKKKTAERFSSASDMAFTLNKAIIRDFKDEAKNWRLL